MMQPPPAGMGKRPPGGRRPPGGKNFDGMPPPHGKDKPTPDLFIEEFDMKQMEKESEDMLRLTFLNQENASFIKTNGGFLNLIMNGMTYERIQIVRTFPFSEPDLLLSVRESSEKAKEIGLIKNYKQDFPETIARLLEEQLMIRYFAPVIEYIYQIKEEGGFAYFHVGTDHGECRFSIRTNSSSVEYLSETRLLFYDLDNNRYEIPDINRLSAKELKKLDLFI